MAVAAIYLQQHMLADFFCKQLLKTRFFHVQEKKVFLYVRRTFSNILGGWVGGWGFNVALMGLWPGKSTPRKWELSTESLEFSPGWLRGPFSISPKPDPRQNPFRRKTFSLPPFSLVKCDLCTKLPSVRKVLTYCRTRPGSPPSPCSSCPTQTGSPRWSASGSGWKRARGRSGRSTRSKFSSFFGDRWRPESWGCCSRRWGCLPGGCLCLELTPPASDSLSFNAANLASRRRTCQPKISILFQQTHNSGNGQLQTYIARDDNLGQRAYCNILFRICFQFGQNWKSKLLCLL